MGKQKFEKNGSANPNRGNAQQKRRRGKAEKNSYEGKGNSKNRPEDNLGNTSGSNSPDWYGGQSTLMANAANISFHTGAGRAITFRDRLGNANTFNPAGIMVLHCLHNPGVANGWNAPVNLAARKLYTYVRHVNSGHSNYDAVDLMMYITMMDNAFAFYAWMVRAYGCMRTVLMRNRYTPVGIINAMGIDYNDIAARLADFRYYINLYATRINQMAVPDNMPIFKRHMWMYSSVYFDAPSEKGQFYMFNPSAFWRYVVTDTERYMEPSIIIPNPESANSKVKLEWIINTGNIILNQILQREDFNIMSGDIMKAYKDSLYKVNPINEDYVVIPAYDPEILLQIHNASVVGMAVGSANYEKYEDSWRIKEVLYDTSDAGALYFLPMLVANYNAYALSADKILDVPFDNPTSTHMAIATRFMAVTDPSTVIKSDDGNDRALCIDVFSTELIMDAHVISADEDGGFWSREEDFVGEVLGDIVHFEQRPFNVVVEFREEGEEDPDSDELLPPGGWHVINYIGDMVNYAVMDVDSLRNVNEAAALAMYGIA